MANPKTRGDGPAIEEVERFMQAAQGEDPSVRAAMAKAFAARNRTADTLWRWVVIGLMLLSALALAGLLYLVADGNPETQPDLVLAAFVGLLGGLMGLLIGAPWQGQGASE
jgi:hypothetical protein